MDEAEKTDVDGSTGDAGRLNAITGAIVDQIEATPATCWADVQVKVRH